VTAPPAVDASLLARLVAAIDAGLAGAGGGAGEAVPPWLGWLTVALLRHRVRQRWHRAVVDTLPEDDYYDDEHRQVPGLPGWRYHFHGIGCCLTGPDGEILDVDRRDDDAAVIDPWFFAMRMKSLRASGPVEERVWRWLPTEGLIVAACDDLRAAGALVSFQGDHFFQLDAELDRRAEAVAGEDMADGATMERWSVVLGPAETPALLAAHRAWVMGLVGGGGERAYDALPGAAEILSGDELVDACLRIIAGRATPATARAIEILRARGEGRGVESVTALLHRLSPTDDLPAPAYEALAYLLERSADPAQLASLFQRFSSVEVAAGFGGNPFHGSYATLALRHLPGLAMTAVRRALRSTTPVCVSEVATLLAAIDLPWCHRELTAALAAPPGPARAYLVEALRRSSGDLAAARATRADVAPTRRPGQVGFTYEEVLHANVSAFFDPGFERARTLAAELRARYPADWAG
jgi:hypothetical protein